MNKQERINSFYKELSLIKNLNIKDFAEKALYILPDYFWEIPASSTGKYHPNYALGNGGLLRHTKAAVRIAVELFKTDLWAFTEDEKDLIIVGLILHDGRKSGFPKEKYTRFDHPILISQAIASDKNINYLLTEDQLSFLLSNIETHMGKWTENKYSNFSLNPPKTIAQRFTHLADYLASRKALEYNFDVDITR